MNILKSVDFLDTKNEQAEREIREIKYLEINLTKDMKDLYNEKYKILKKEIEEDARIVKDVPCSCIGRINIVKMAMLPKTIYKFNTISIKISMPFLKEIEKSM
jgi:hypothetical protein